MNISELMKFQPKQVDALNAVKGHTFTLYGGAAGGGKSYFLRWIGIYLLLKWAKETKLTGIRIGLFCEDYPSLKDRQISKIKYEFPAWLGTFNQSEHEFTLHPAYGSGVMALRNLDDPSKYLSSEFAAVLIDELTRNPKDTFDFLNMRRRWPSITETKLIAATNPGGVGHAWVRKLWIDKDFTQETFNPQDFAFISAKATDNRYLGEEYEKQLSTLPEKLRKAYRDGNWDIFAGQYFTEWDKSQHVIEPFDIPEGWTRITGIDYGFEKPSACYWLAIDYDGIIYVYRELYQTGLTYSQLGKRIKYIQGPQELIEYNVADTSMFAKTLDTGEYGQDIMAKEGVPIIPANKDRLAGWNLMHDYLRLNRIKFFKNCNNAIRTIPALVYKDGTEDIDKASEDHAADAIRYALMSLPPIPEKQEPKVYNPYTNDKDSPWYQRMEVTDPYSYENLQI
jgi:hypothetical protein